GIEYQGKRRRSDILILASYDPKQRSLVLLSIPRDSRVEITCRKNALDKINAAHAYDGLTCAKDTVERFTGVPVHHYIQVQLDGFKDLVDLVGGVELEVEQDMKYTDRAGGLFINLRKGYQLLDGDKARQFVRYRSAEGDIGRIGRTQKFLNALITKLLQPGNWPKIPKVLDRAVEMVRTSLKSSDLAALGLIQTVQAAFSLDKLEMITLPGEPKRIGGIDYWIPDQAELLKIVGEKFKEEAVLVINQEIKVEILNGNGNAGEAATMANSLRERGFEVTRVANADRFDYPVTRVINHTSDREVGRLVLLAVGGTELLTEIPQEQEAAVDVTVILGKDRPGPAATR
ncbi:MAG: LCP family protein, partial [Firmicutes bacterium]|nr:LCP family protein [Bacillota bacterium]